MAARAAHPASKLRVLLRYRLAMVVYLSAIWTMRRAFGQIADGEPFDRVLPTLLSRLGSALSGRAIVSILVGPLLLRALVGSRHAAFAAQLRPILRSRTDTEIRQSSEPPCPAWWPAPRQ